MRVSEEEVAHGLELLSLCTVRPPSFVVDMEIGAANWLRHYAIDVLNDNIDARQRIRELEADLEAYRVAAGGRVPFTHRPASEIYTRAADGHRADEPKEPGA